MKYLLFVLLFITFWAYADNPLLNIPSQYSSEDINQWIQDYNINSHNKKHETPLILAVKHRQYDIIQALLDHHAKVNHSDIDGNTALHHAIKNKDLKSVELLLHHPSQSEHQSLIKDLMETNKLDINAQNKKHETPLILAVKYRQYDIIQLLLNLHVKVNLADIEGNTALHHAVQNEDIKSVQHLFQYQKQHEHQSLIKDLLDTNKLDINHLNKKQQAPLHLAVLLEVPNIVQAFLDQGAHVDISNDEHPSPLHLAVMNKNIPIMKQLIAGHANVNNRKNASEVPPINLLPLLADIDESQLFEIAKILIEAGAHLNINNITLDIPDSKRYTYSYTHTTNNTLLHWAVLQSYRTIVQLLLNNGAKHSIKNKEGITPFLFAIQNELLDTAQTLIHHGVDVNETYANKMTPLHYAARNKNLKMVELLLMSSANPNSQNANGDTPLLLALNSSIISHSVDEDTITTIVKSLLLAGAHTNIQNSEGMNPAINAAMSNHPEALQMLIDHKADIHLTDKTGYSIILQKLNQLKKWTPQEDFSKIEQILQNNGIQSHSCQNAIQKL